MEQQKLTGLTPTQRNIRMLRKRINRRSLEEKKIHPFARYKVLTYLWIFLFTPYGVFRLYRKNSGFGIEEKIVQSIAAIVYACIVLSYIGPRIH